MYLKALTQPFFGFQLWLFKNKTIFHAWRLFLVHSNFLKGKKIGLINQKWNVFLWTEPKFLGVYAIKIYKQLLYFILHLQNDCVVDILLRCECMEIKIRFLKIFDPIVTEISSAHIERGLAHGSALSLDLSHFRLRILGYNKNMKISRSLNIMTPVTQIPNWAGLAVLVCRQIL